MWQAIKGLIIEDDGKTQAPAARSVSPLPATVMGSGGTQPTFSANNEFVDLLRSALKSRPTAFTALLNAADKLATVIPDANMRLKAAYEMVKSEGRGLNELLAAIEIHAQDLASQERQFTAAAEQALGNAVGTMERELNTIGPANDQARQQIETLQQQIAHLNTVIANNSVRQTELTGKIAEERAHFDASKLKFSSALGTVQAELQSQKMVISSTLS